MRLSWRDAGDPVHGQGRRRQDDDRGRDRGAVGRGGPAHADHVTDPAHSLADAFEVVIGDDPTEIEPNLWAQQIDAQERLEDNWREIQDYMVQVMNWAGTETIQAEELTVIPGIDEIFALIDVKTHVESGAYDVLIVDCAPTAETLRLLSLPDIMNWYIERIFPVQRRVVKVVRPLVSRTTSLPIAGDKVFEAVERLHHNLEPSVTSSPTPRCRRCASS